MGYRNMEQANKRKADRSGACASGRRIVGPPAADHHRRALRPRRRRRRRCNRLIETNGDALGLLRASAQAGILTQEDGPQPSQVRLGARDSVPPEQLEQVGGFINQMTQPGICNGCPSLDNTHRRQYPTIHAELPRGSQAKSVTPYIFENNARSDVPAKTSRGHPIPRTRRTRRHHLTRYIAELAAVTTLAQESARATWSYVWMSIDLRGREGQVQHRPHLSLHWTGRLRHRHHTERGELHDYYLP